MGKPLIIQRRGKGTPSFSAPSHRFKADAHYLTYTEEVRKGEIIDFVDDPARSGLLMLLLYEDGQTCMIPAPEGIKIGDIIEEGPNAKPEIGSIMPLYAIPEGFPIFNLEVTPGDGGKLIRSSGTCGYVVSKEEGRVLVKLPSGKMKYFDARCRATIGNVCGGERIKKPLLKAGNAYYKYKARNQWWPRVRGVAMDAVDHPHGGKEHHPGKPTTVKRTAPPGQKVGHIGARRTGRRKR